MSKAFYFLYDKICNPINIWWAYKNAARGKRYTPAVAYFEYDLEKNLIEIEQELKEKTYQPGGYHSFEIDKPKRRLVNAAPSPHRRPSTNIEWSAVHPFRIRIPLGVATVVVPTRSSSL